MTSQAEHAATGAASPPTAGSAPLEEFTYNDTLPRMFMTATVIWALVATLAGVVVALQLVLPVAVEWLELHRGASAFTWTLRQLYEQQFLAFGRLRPLHTNAAIFAFAGNAIFAAIYYSTQRLCKARVFSDTLGLLHFWGWQLIIVSAALTLPSGITQGKEYAELEWPIDLAIAVVWVGFFGVNFFGTLARRRERHMYVALWFYIATIITVAMLHVFNNLWVPVGLVHFFKTGQMPSLELLLKSYPIYAGVQDALMQWWYGHNAVAFFLTTPFLGLMYYFLPKAAERPVFSYKLSIIHFWSLIFIYIWAGPHHLHYTALPEWASTLGMLFSVMLWMPSWGGMINGLLTLRGAWNRVAKDPILKFFVVGVTFYGMSTFEGPMLSVKLVNSLSHYTDWTVAHVHSGTLGWNGFMAFGMVYWLLPRLFQTNLWSKKLAEWHFWVGTLGIIFYIFPIYAAGITQGLMWRAFDSAGRLAYPDFVETVTQIIPFYWIRVLGGSLYVVGVTFALVNLVMTWKGRPATYEKPIIKAPALSRIAPEDAHAPSRLGEAVVGAGHAMDKLAQMTWHRRWERLPLRFSVWVFIAVAIGGLIEAIPTFLIKENIPTIKTVTPYTPLEQAGRDIYVSEGCYNCHSQMIRPMYAETKRYGDYGKPGEFVYDRPFQWGSRRIGPDLQREGGKRSDQWHAQHMLNPRSLNDKSVMPSYPWLFHQDLKFDEIQARIDALAMLGQPYGPLIEGDNATRHARAQADQILASLEAQQGGRFPTKFEPVIDASGAPVMNDDGTPKMQATEFLDANKKVIAIIAYLQRLGVDLYKTEPDVFVAPGQQQALVGGEEGVDATE
ncbi:MAG: cytochrome-c oxidase, cbb3-type subunit I [Phycisphaeraceae bacterium]|nr:MAG: cytochrome-c oxidase, cbb3-type subunit I [Phycisphaeraceae bacterium]